MSGQVLSKHKFHVNQEVKASAIVAKEEPKPSNQNHEWLETYLNNVNEINEYYAKLFLYLYILLFLQFKKDILTEMEIKMKDIVQTPQVFVEKATGNTCQKCNSKLGVDQHFYDLDACSMPLDEKTNKLLRMLLEARLIDRPLKKAYIEEELQMSG